MVILVTHTVYGKTTDMFGNLKISAAINETCYFKPKLMLQVEKANIELLKLVLYIEVDYRRTILIGVLWNT